MTEPPADWRRREFVSACGTETEAIGAAFGLAIPTSPARALRAWLSGDLGAGKTTFVRGLLRRLGASGAVRSPTYSLIERYQLGAREIVHGDLYRLEDPGGLAALGLDDFDRPGALWLIEWPERGEGLLPTPDLRLQFSVRADSHAIEAMAVSDAGAAWLAGVPGRQPDRRGHNA